MTDGRVTWPAAERNKDPILEVLREVLPERGTLLEVASGTGQHAAHFAGHLRGLTWQPSDAERGHHASIAAWTAGLPNVLPPIALDVTRADWEVSVLDAVYNANMIHIAPWEVCLGLMRGVGTHLRAGGVMALYGPFRIGGEHTAPSNADFDQSLRGRDPSWGVRDLEAVSEIAAGHGLSFERRVQMPANNQLVVYRRGE
ncbi:MAG: DUF938 domain-containing protein [Myxococcales bacterium]|nr:DUF938 domain-containing protein [Myxococcales bacterium]